ncbi:hypothetical protein B0T24DRAFT_667941 [Lasiosphaeria ovina]|uniref:Uncharacterized protein n=1 Tax=Lasiosphaeria ovina TaxID=92902 RepID=A0AAE0K6Y6_9PEZI|nr:hypothetical protein B0T24DRAFT_667941 [Lasiosphaeria ovina]
MSRIYILHRCLTRKYANTQNLSNKGIHTTAIIKMDINKALRSQESERLKKKEGEKKKEEEKKEKETEKEKMEGNPPYSSIVSKNKFARLLPYCLTIDCELHEVSFLSVLAARVFGSCGVLYMVERYRDCHQFRNRSMPLYLLVVTSPPPPAARQHRPPSLARPTYRFRASRPRRRLTAVVVPEAGRRPANQAPVRHVVAELYHADVVT